MRNLPNLLAISNLSLGVLAIIAIFNHHYFASIEGRARMIKRRALPISRKDAPL